MSLKSVVFALVLFSASVAFAQPVPVRETTSSRDGLTLVLKHFDRPGAVPVLLVHGLAQNDRCWDAAVAQYSFGQFLYRAGFDVWIGNMRAAGTPGFRSDSPKGLWTVDDFAIHDFPALVAKVESATGRTPFLMTHSLGTWALQGYLAGVGYDTEGRVRPDSRAGLARRAKIPGIITIAGVYNLWWTKHVDEAFKDPIRSKADFFHSNYELELFARMRPLYYLNPHVKSLPLGWVGRLINLPLASIPFIGGALERLYENFQDDVVATPLLSMLYYPPNVDPDMVRLHGRDGLEDLGPLVLEQLGNAINEHQTVSYFHLTRPDESYVYSRVLRQIDVPMLVIAGDRDRLANVDMNYQDGFQKIHSKDKQFLAVDAGHLDILAGKAAEHDVMTPVVTWLRSH